MILHFGGFLEVHVARERPRLDQGQVEALEGVSFFPSIHLSIYLSIYLSISLSLSLSIYIYIYIYIHIYI